MRIQNDFEFTIRSMSQARSEVSEDENDENEQTCSPTEMSNLVMAMEKHKILLSKSQVPEVKARKAKAIEIVIEDFFKTTGKTYDSKAIQKKIANMKARVKSKTDRKKTGNRKIKLLAWEEAFLKLMEHDDNPVFTRVKCKEFHIFECLRL